MNPEIKQLWVDALRSGDYEQGKGALVMGNKYCCLGVLCDLAIKAGVPITHIKNVSLPPQGGDQFSDENGPTVVGLLPELVVKWAHLDSCDPQVVNGSCASRLSLVNDDGFDFNTIADLIESQL